MTAIRLYNGILRLLRAIALVTAAVFFAVACRDDPLTVTEQDVQSSDASLFTRTAAMGESDEVLIAINGGPGLSSHYMVDLEQLAGPELAVVTYDQRGTGRSTEPSEPPGGYNLSDYVEDLEVIRQTIGADSVHLFGHSWGGLIAMRYAMLYPDKVSSLVLMGSAPSTWTELNRAFAKFDRRVRELQGQGAIPNVLPSNSQDRLEAILPAYFSDPAFQFSPRELGTSHNDSTNQRSWSAVRNYDYTIELSELDLPVLILWGQDDPFGLPMAEATHESLINADVEFILLEGCGHFWQECPDQFFPRVQDFLGK